jgi:hypothetical protein
LEQTTEVAVLRGVRIAREEQRRGPLLADSRFPGVLLDGYGSDERAVALADTLYQIGGIFTERIPSDRRGVLVFVCVQIYRP